MIKSFRGRHPQELLATGKARRFPSDEAKQASRKLEYLDLATEPDDLTMPQGNRRHELKDDRKGRYSFSANDQWRTCLRFLGGDACDVEICGYHQMRCSMNIANAGIKRRPTHTGETLREDFLPDCDRTVSAFAEAVGASRQSINELPRGRRAVSPEMALRLDRLFGNRPDSWLNAQRAVDLWYAGQATENDVRRIKPLGAA